MPIRETTCRNPRQPPYVTVLVVDDERISRHVASRMLRELGLRVLEADGAEEALDVFRISQHPIDLVLLDVVMPETDGVELAEQILALQPAQRIIFMSAHPAEVLGGARAWTTSTCSSSRSRTPWKSCGRRVGQAMERHVAK